jgi:REP element-mobilizing transposase RayT
VILDRFVIMPNHIHGVVVIADSEKFVGAPLVGAQKGMNTQQNGAGIRPAPTLGDIMCTFKSIATDEYIRGVRERGWQPFHKKLWQRNYYDHIIRSEEDMNKIREYIETNPSGWHEDEENPLKIR